MRTNPKLLSTAEEIQSLAKALEGCEVFAFDTEFIRENTFFPVVEIIQVATDSESWLVDAQAFKKGYRPGPNGKFDPALKPLLDVFENKKILKIVHAAQGDQECLYTSFASVASPTLDTAVAASLCGYGDSIGLSKLLKQVLGVTLAKGHARTNWSVRPLPEQLLEYAHADVIHLVELGRRLLSHLDNLGRRTWALELSAKWEDTSLYEPDFTDLAQRLARGGRLDKKGFAALMELIRWREDRVRHLNLPRRWVADDAVLLDLARVRPKDIAHLSAFRGLNKGEVKNSGEAILEALRKSEASETGTSFHSARPEIPSSEEAQALDLLRCFVGILADEHRIAMRHLMGSSQLLALLRSEAKSQDDLVKKGVLSPEATRLIGDEIIEFLSGRRALSIVQERGEAKIRVARIGDAQDSVSPADVKPKETLKKDSGGSG